MAGKSKRHNWELNTRLYNYGYTTQDIGAITGTSSGTISKGLTGRVHKRRRGATSMQVSPTKFDSDTIALLRQEGYYDFIHEYYDNVSLLLKASYVYGQEHVKPLTEIAANLGVNLDEIQELKARTNKYTAPYHESYRLIGNPRGVSEAKAQVLRELGQQNRFKAWRISMAREENYASR